MAFFTVEIILTGLVRMWIRMSEAKDIFGESKKSIQSIEDLIFCVVGECEDCENCLIEYEGDICPDEAISVKGLQDFVEGLIAKLNEPSKRHHELCDKELLGTITDVEKEEHEKVLDKIEEDGVRRMWIAEYLEDNLILKTFDVIEVSNDEQKGDE